MVASPEGITGALDTIRNTGLMGLIRIQEGISGFVFEIALISIVFCLIPALLENNLGRWKLLSKVLSMTAIAWLLNHWNEWMQTLWGDFTHAGVVLGGNSMQVADFYDPGAIVAAGWAAVTPIVNHTDRLTMAVTGWYYIVHTLIYTAAAVFIMAAFLVSAVQTFFYNVEYWTVGTVAYILVPFIMWSPLAFIGERAFGFIVSLMVRFLVLAAVTSMFELMFLRWAYSGSPTLLEAFATLALGIAAFVSAVWAARSAHGVLNGSAVGEGIAAIASMWGMARLATASVGGGVGIVRGAANLIQSGAWHARNAASRISGGRIAPPPPLRGAGGSPAGGGPGGAGALASSWNSGPTPRQQAAAQSAGLDISGLNRGQASYALAAAGMGGKLPPGSNYALTAAQLVAAGISPSVAQRFARAWGTSTTVPGSGQQGASGAQQANTGPGAPSSTGRATSGAQAGLGGASSAAAPDHGGPEGPAPGEGLENSVPAGDWTNVVPLFPGVASGVATSAGQAASPGSRGKFSSAAGSRIGGQALSRGYSRDRRYGIRAASVRAFSSAGIRSGLNEVANLRAGSPAAPATPEMMLDYKLTRYADIARVSVNGTGKAGQEFSERLRAAEALPQGTAEEMRAKAKEMRAIAASVAGRIEPQLQQTS